ncbi:MAG: HeH/LEM domain-containing protein, partial [Alkalibacterium sp.]|nr:HeH/LEM domain-containing protein [Alkalibacterium sp.]
MRGILNEYDIPYPSNAKKTDLIKLFNDEIKPNASKYMQQYERSIKNLNDVGFINATTGKMVRRSKRSTSAEVEGSDATKGKKSKATKMSAPSDVSGMESDTEATTKESKRTKRKPKNNSKKYSSDDKVTSADLSVIEIETKQKDSKKSKKSPRDETADEATSADLSIIEIETKQQLVAVDDGKSYVEAEIKLESTFSNENVFQSPPSSAGTKKLKSPSDYKSPSMSKKRRRENDEYQKDTPDKKPRVPSAMFPKSPSAATSKASSHKKGYLFDDNESSDSDTDIFSKSIINQVKSPKLSKIKKQSSKKSTPIKIDKETPAKKRTPGDNNITPGNKTSISDDKKIVPQDTTPSQSTENHQHLSSAKNSSKKSNSVKSSTKKNKSSTSDNSFLSLTEEQDDFDKEQSKIKSKGKSVTKHSPRGGDVLTSADLASQLGITIQGLPPKDFQLSDNSFAGIKSDTPTKKLSPRSRRNKNQKISQPDFDKLSDDEEEKEEDKGKKFDKIQNGIKEEIEKLNDVLEKENSISIKK